MAVKKKLGKQQERLSEVEQHVFFWKNNCSDVKEKDTLREEAKKVQEIRKEAARTSTKSVRVTIIEEDDDYGDSEESAEQEVPPLPEQRRFFSKVDELDYKMDEMQAEILAHLEEQRLAHKQVVTTSEELQFQLKALVSKQAVLEDEQLKVEQSQSKSVEFVEKQVNVVLSEISEFEKRTNLAVAEIRK